MRRMISLGLLSILLVVASITEARQCDDKTKIKVLIWNESIVMCCDSYKIWKGGKLWCKDTWEVKEQDWKYVEINEAYPPYTILPIQED